MRLNPAGTAARIGRQRSSRTRLLLAAASGLAVLAAGCSTSGGAGGSDSQVITIVAVPGIDDAPLYLAKQDGLFAAAGLQHVVIKKESQEKAEFSALQSNQAQIAATDYGNILYEQSQPSGPRYTILANGYNAASGTLEVLTLPNSPITQPAQLEGARVGLPSDDILPAQQGSPRSLEAAAATQVLQDYVGMTPSTVKWVPMAESTEVSALEDHSVQAILVGQPYIFQAEQQAGAVEVVDVASNFTANLPLSGYVANSSWARQNPTAVADFRSAMATAQANASMAGPIQKVLPQLTGVTQQEADLAAIGSYPTTTTPGEITRVENLLWNNGLIKSRPPIAQMIAK